MKESGEMYLETILVLSGKKDRVRAIDIVEDMNFSKPSVSRALAKLREEGCVCVDGNGTITLTARGKQIAEKIYERHDVLSRVLVRLGVSEETAKADACKMEHDISDESFNAIKKVLRE